MGFLLKDAVAFNLLFGFQPPFDAGKYCIVSSILTSSLNWNISRVHLLSLLRRRTDTFITYLAAHSSFFHHLRFSGRLASCGTPSCRLSRTF